ncbi:MAG: FG-GAP-like repeat-containing protein [Candidatus Kapaibacterium sp.]
MNKYIKHLLLLLSIHLLISHPGFAQLFTKVTTGEIVQTTSDSRSVNLIDINNDGYDDIVISNGPKAGAKNHLFINNGKGTFTTILDNPLVQDSAPFDGATFADIDNDGDIDAFFVTWYGKPNYFYINNGNGSFTRDILAFQDINSTYSETAAWADYNNDGYVDLLITNSAGDKRNLLFKNNGNGTFQRITEGDITNDSYTSRGITWVDYDNDGDMDVFVVNEENTPNTLYRNDGNSSFTRIFNSPLTEQSYSSMSSSWADTDNDGDFDVVVSNSGFYTPQANQYYLNNGNGEFTEVTDSPIHTDGGCSYSSSFADYDNDGDVDLVITNGFCNGTIENFLYNNDGSGKFTRDTQSIPDLRTACSYGCAWGDLNNDGFPDLVIASCQNKATSPLPSNQMYINHGNTNTWLKLNIIGMQSNKSAIGASIKVLATINGKKVWQTRDVSTQTGYCSQNSLTVHFGLGTATIVDSIIVRFPSGSISTLQNISTNQQISITENTNTSVHHIGFTRNIQMIPISNYLQLSIVNNSPDEFKEITITDILGSTLVTSMLHAGNNTTNISTLPNGSYYIALTTQTGRLYYQTLHIMR